MKTSRALVFRLAAVVILAVVVWVSVASYIVPKLPDSGSFWVKGEYEITSVRDGQERLYEGPVYFEYAERHSGMQNNPVFKLHFLNSEDTAGRGFGFMIPLQGAGKVVALENYEVTSRERDFTRTSESVFGYADLIDGNGKLYFTETGNISIQYATNREVAGEINMLLRDASGNSMRLEGRFSALPLY